jgi:hypothetical protein
MDEWTSDIHQRQAFRCATGPLIIPADCLLSSYWALHPILVWRSVAHRFMRVCSSALHPYW